MSLLRKSSSHAFASRRAAATAAANPFSCRIALTLARSCALSGLTAARYLPCCRIALSRFAETRFVRAGREDRR
jgi:hypothetical protein